MPSVAPSAKLVLPGTEVRCQARIFKVYGGDKKLKTCNALLAVVETNIHGGGSVTVVAKCYKANCGNMVHYQIDC